MAAYSCRNHWCAHKLQHRQDLFGGVVAGLVVPQQDRVTMTATLPAGPSGSFVLAIVHRDAHGVLNERYDLVRVPACLVSGVRWRCILLCSQLPCVCALVDMQKTFARQLSHPAMPAAFSVYSEHGEVTKLVLDSDARIAQLLSHALVGQSLDYVIISDQARPPALPDSTVPTGVLPPRKTLTLAYRLPHNAQARQAVVPVYTAFVCWLMDAVDGMHVRGDVAAKLRTRRAQVLEAAQREQSKQQEHERREAAEKRLKEARRADPDKYKKRDEKKEKKRTANRVKMMRS